MLEIINISLYRKLEISNEMKTIFTLVVVDVESLCKTL